MAFTKGTAKLTSGSKVAIEVSVTSGQLAYFSSGTAVFVQSQGQLIEAVGLTKDGNGNVVPNQFSLRELWGAATGTYEFVAFDTIEGLRDAIQSARGFSEQLQVILESLSVAPGGNSLTKRTNDGRVKTANARDDDDAIALNQAGTSFSRNVGTGTGDVMEVGAFGLGGSLTSQQSEGASSSGGYVKLATVNGSYSSAGDSITLFASGFGDIASRLRDDYIIQMGERGGNVTCSVFSFRPGANSTRFYTKKVGSFKYELWAELNSFDSGGTVTKITGGLRGGTGLTVGSVQTTAPTDLVPADIVRTFVYPDTNVTFDNITANSLNVSGSKNFRIVNPVNENEYLYHSAIESDKPRTQYVLHITVDSSLTATYTLPDWFHSLNGNTCTVFPAPCRHFGQAYGEVSDGVLTLTANQAGKYHVLIMAERSDEAVKNWKLTETIPAEAE